jgi:hypothetical protein
MLISSRREPVAFYIPMLYKSNIMLEITNEWGDKKEVKQKR